MPKQGNSNGDDETIDMPCPSRVSPMGFVAPASALVDVDVAAATHRGHVRANNEDHYLSVRFGRSLETIFTNIAEGFLEPSFDEVGYGMIVADGIGGMAAGDEASRMALCKLVEMVVSTPDWIMKLDRRQDMATVMRRMTERFRSIDDALRERAESDRALFGMGTTLTLAASLGSNLVIGHMGDSRAYLLRNQKLHQLTRDDTLAQALIDSGIADPEDTATRAMRHVLTAAIGSTAEPVDPQVQRLHLSQGDQVLLCTDGLTGMVNDDMIASTLREATSANEACQTLIDLALSAGGVDNVTVVLACYHFPA